MPNGDNNDDFLRFLAQWGAAFIAAVFIMFVITHLGDLGNNVR